MRAGNEFMRGLVAGTLGTLAAGASLLYVLGRLGLLHSNASLLGDPAAWLDWAYVNLGSSIPVFTALLLAYFVTLGKLRRRIGEAAAIEKVVQLDHLADTWTTLFFGAGVIWTAIGMRSALIFALGDREAALSDGAFAMLERMIDGGILLALSTTIVGGIGGYLMRVWKTVTLGAELQQQYDRAARADTSEMRASLGRIERHLQAAGLRPPADEAGA